MASWLPLATVAVLAVPAALVLAPAFAPSGDDGVGPPFYEPSGLGVFPSEGSFGTHGCARPAAIADLLAGAVPEGTEVCLETAAVA